MTQLMHQFNNMNDYIWGLLGFLLDPLNINKNLKNINRKIDTINSKLSNVKDETNKLSNHIQSTNCIDKIRRDIEKNRDILYWSINRSNREIISKSERFNSIFSKINSNVLIKVLSSDDDRVIKNLSLEKDKKDFYIVFRIIDNENIEHYFAEKLDRISELATNLKDIC